MFFGFASVELLYEQHKYQCHISHPPPANYKINLPFYMSDK